MTPYRQSNRYTQQLERELGEVQKRCEWLAWDRDMYKSLFHGSRVDRLWRVLAPPIVACMYIAMLAAGLSFASCVDDMSGEADECAELVEAD